MGEYSDPGGVAPDYPAGGVTDPSGNRFVADSGGDRILKYDPTGGMSVIDAAGWDRPRAIARDPQNGDLWVADTTDNQIVEITPNGTHVSTYGGSQSFTKAPFGIAADSTGIYVADTYNYRVFKMSRGGTKQWTQGSACGQTFGRPRGLDVADTGAGGAGELYVADTDHSRIVVLDPSTGSCLRSFGSAGPNPGQFRAPRSVTGDGGSGIWVAEAQAPRLQHLTRVGVSLGTIGSYGSGPGKFRAPACVFLDGSYVDVCDTYEYVIQRFTNTTVPAYHDSLPNPVVRPTLGGFNEPFGTAYGPSGELYVSDMFNHRMERRAPSANWLAQGTWTSWGGFGTRAGSFQFPRGVDVSDDGQTVVVTNSENNRIDLYTPTGTLIRSIRPGGSSFGWPHQNRVLHLSSDGTIVLTITNGGSMRTPRGVAIDGQGYVYVADSGNNKIEKFNASTGALVSTLATSGTGPTNVRLPWNLTVAGPSSDRRLYITDGTNNRVVVMSLTGNPICTFGSTGSGNGHFSSPRSVAVYPKDQDPTQVAVADFGSNRIALWSPC